MGYTLLQKKVYWKNQSVPNTCAILPLKKIFYQDLTVNRLIFQIPIKYIKLVIPKILFFMLVFCSFNFYFKNTWPPHLPPPAKLKFLTLPPARFFLKFPLNRFKLFSVKSFISSPSNSDFQVIILCNSHLQLQSFLCIIF